MEPVTVDVQVGELQRLCKLAMECAEDLEAELRERWMPSKAMASRTMERHFDRDMEPVRELMQIAKRVGHRCGFFRPQQSDGGPKPE